MFLLPKTAGFFEDLKQGGGPNMLTSLKIPTNSMVTLPFQSP